LTRSITPGTEENADGDPVLFVRRWNVLVAALLVEPSVKLVAYQAGQYGLADGLEIFPGNERLSRETGLCEKTVREAWHYLRGLKMAVRDSRSKYNGRFRTADEYQLAIPEHWDGYAILGPSSRRFTCQYCGSLFNPPACAGFLTDAKGAYVLDRDGNRDVRWYLHKAAFCPAPRPPRKLPNGRRPARQRTCFERWRAEGGKWGDDDSWDVFRKARDDPWP
jgi:hypothetical protein